MLALTYPKFSFGRQEHHRIKLEDFRIMESDDHLKLVEFAKGPITCDQAFFFFYDERRLYVEKRGHDRRLKGHRSPDPEV